MGDTERQDLDDNLVNSSSRLKLSFRSECSRQSFLCFNKHTLPFELQELILAHLPALKLAELKGVSRSWRVLLQSPRFKEKCKSIRGGCSSDYLDVWVMKSTNEEEDLMAYIPSLKKYGPFLQLICIPLVIAKACMGCEWRKRKCLCGSGPLFLFGDKDWQSKGFSMFNLQTCQSQHLKRVPIQIFNAGGGVTLRQPVLIAAEDHSQFCLVVETCSHGIFGSHPDYELFVYKSTTASWTSYPQESAIEAGFGQLSSIDFCHYNDEDSTLYAWSEAHWYKVYVSFPSSEALLMQDIHSRGTTSTHTEARAFKVFKCEGHVLLITSLVQSVQGFVTQGFMVWKLVRGEESWNWTEISRAPHELCLKSYNEERLFPPTFMSDGRRICAIASSHEFFPPLVYDVEHDSWCHLHGVLKNMQALFTMKMMFNSGNL